ncbi:MAG: GGDEF domain-containing protein [Lachnospiraceae bacterium]|nr:GGDEF domain-containing protein [Lachnospiraceae bacterium]
MNTFLVGNGIFTDQFKCNDTDEELLSYLGVSWKSVLTDHIYENDREVFLNAVHLVTSGSELSSSVRIRFFTSTGETRNCRVRIHNKRDEHFFIEIVDIENACDSCYNIISQQKKNQWLLAQTGTILFDFSFSTKEVEIYRYSDNGTLNLSSAPNISRLASVISKDISDNDINFSYRKNFTVGGHNYQIIGNVQYLQTEKISLYGFIREDVDDSLLSSWGDTHDAMTGLYNKPYALSEAKRLVESDPSVNLSFVMIDIDDFKTINDSFGHFFGDKVIQKMAQILHEATDGRGFASRFGGDEFFLCLMDMRTEDELRGVIQSIAFKYRNAFPDVDYKFTTSIGIAEYPRNSKSYDILLKKADRALYIAKFKGKARYIIYKEELHGEINEAAPDSVKPDTASRDAQHAGAKKLLSLYTQAFSVNNDPEQITGIIDDMFVEIMIRYGFDAISVYSGKEWLPMWRKGHYPDAPSDASYMNDPAVTCLFTNLGTKSTNFNLKGDQIESYHKRLKECGIVCARQIVIGDVKEAEALFSYDSFRDTGGWPSEEMNDLIFYSHILYSLMIKVIGK